jgi:putative protease
VARTCQAYRQAIDDAVAGRGLDPALLGQLDGPRQPRLHRRLPFQRHTPHETQNYLRGHSESGRSLYVGDVVAYDAARGLAEVASKNAFCGGRPPGAGPPRRQSAKLQVERLHQCPPATPSPGCPAATTGSGCPCLAESVGAFVATFSLNPRGVTPTTLRKALKQFRMLRFRVAKFTTHVYVPQRIKR